MSILTRQSLHRYARRGEPVVVSVSPYSTKRSDDLLALDKMWCAMCEHIEAIVSREDYKEVVLQLDKTMADIEAVVTHALVSMNGETWPAAGDREVATLCSAIGIALTESAIAIGERQSAAVLVLLIISLSVVPKEGHGAWSDARTLAFIVRLCSSMNSRSSIPLRLSCCCILAELRKFHREPWRLDLASLCILLETSRHVCNAVVVETDTIIGKVMPNACIGDLLKGTRLEYLAVLLAVSGENGGLTNQLRELTRRLEIPSGSDRFGNNVDK